MAQKNSGRRAALTDKQERYVQELIKGKSQRDAYKTAYPSSLKWSDKTVDEAACRLFNNSKVNARYHQLHDRLIKEAEDDCIVDAKAVLKELSNIAFANVTDFVNVESDELGSKVKINNTATLPDDKKAALAEIGTTQAGIRIKQHDKVKALELLGKHLKLFTDKVETELSGNVNNPLADFSTEELRELLKK